MGARGVWLWKLPALLTLCTSPNLRGLLGEFQLAAKLQSPRSPAQPVGSAAELGRQMLVECLVQRICQGEALQGVQLELGFEAWIGVRRERNFAHVYSTYLFWSTS